MRRGGHQNGISSSSSSSSSRLRTSITAAPGNVALTWRTPSPRRSISSAISASDQQFAILGDVPCLGFGADDGDDLAAGRQPAFPDLGFERLGAGSGGGLVQRLPGAGHAFGLDFDDVGIIGGDRPARAWRAGDRTAGADPDRPAAAGDRCPSAVPWWRATSSSRSRQALA